MKNLLTWLMNPPPDGPASTLLLRLMAGGVFLWEGIMKFVLKSGSRSLHEIGHAVPPFHRRLCRHPRDRWRIVAAFRFHDAADCDSVHHRDDRGHTLDENLDVSRHITIAFAAGAAADWNVGRFA